jgi:hypothetical protein
MIFAKQRILSALAVIAVAICGLSAQSTPSVGNGPNIRLPILNAFNVNDFGADPTGTVASDVAIQKTIVVNPLR